MTVHHHLPGDWILAQATGGLSEAQQVVAAAHLTLCPSCRAALAAAESLATDALLDAPPLALTTDLDALMARLDEPSPPEAPLPADPVLPWPVLRYTGPLAEQQWTWLAPGVHGVDLSPPTEGLPLRLLRMRAGSRLPHRHQGREAAVVLAGGWSDEYGSYRRGDATFYDPEEHPTHNQRVDDDEDCIAIVLNEVQAHVGGPLAPLARLLFKV